MSCAGRRVYFEDVNSDSELYNDVECDSYGSDDPLRYCYSYPHSVSHSKKVYAGPVVYVFYKDSGDAGAFFDSGMARAFGRIFKKSGGVAPVFISIAFSGGWTGGSGEDNTAGARHRVLMDFFDNREPYIVDADSTSLLGVGIGAFNALSFFLRYPSAFGAVAVVCPVLDGKELDGLIKSGGIFSSEWKYIDPVSLVGLIEKKWSKRRVFFMLSSDDSPRVLSVMKGFLNGGYDVEVFRTAGGGDSCRVDPAAVAWFFVKVFSSN